MSLSSFQHTFMQQLCDFLNFFFCVTAYLGLFHHHPNQTGLVSTVTSSFLTFPSPGAGGRQPEQPGTLLHRGGGGGVLVLFESLLDQSNGRSDERGRRGRSRSASNLYATFESAHLTVKLCTLQVWFHRAHVNSWASQALPLRGLAAWFRQPGPPQPSLAPPGWRLASSSVGAPSSRAFRRLRSSPQYEYWVFSPGFQGQPEELSERARTEHCMPFYCTRPRMVQYQLVFCCKCLPVVLRTGLSLSYQDSTSMFTLRLRRRPDQRAPPEIRIFLLAAISVHPERTARWERRPVAGLSDVQTRRNPAGK